MASARLEVAGRRACRTPAEGLADRAGAQGPRRARALARRRARRARAPHRPARPDDPLGLVLGQRLPVVLLAADPGAAARARLVAAHEVAHLLEMNHGARFWKLVARSVPRIEEAKHWLRHEGTDLHRYAGEADERGEGARPYPSSRPERARAQSRDLAACLPSISQGSRTASASASASGMTVDVRLGLRSREHGGRPEPRGCPCRPRRRTGRPGSSARTPRRRP